MQCCNLDHDGHEAGDRGPLAGRRCGVAYVGLPSEHLPQHLLRLRPAGRDAVAGSARA